MHMKTFFKYAFFLATIITRQLCLGNALEQDIHVEETDRVDLIIFSFDRPLQLYALMESIGKYITGIINVSVLYRVSNDEFDSAYNRCFENFRKRYAIHAIKQGSSPRQDFKPITLSLLEKSTARYILFAVDDIIVTDYVDLNQCISALEQYNAYGFYLRMGKDISYSYTAKTPSPVPVFKNHANDIISWHLHEGIVEWAYLNTVDMTIYHRVQILNALSQLSFSSPNTLEAAWAYYGTTNVLRNALALCYTSSKIINVPLNLVQHDWRTASNMGYDLKELLELFNQGFRIDVDSYYKFKHDAPHIEIQPRLVRIVETV